MALNLPLVLVCEIKTMFACECLRFATDSDARCEEWREKGERERKNGRTMEKEKEKKKEHCLSAVRGDLSNFYVSSEKSSVLMCVLCSDVPWLSPLFENPPLTLRLHEECKCDVQWRTFPATHVTRWSIRLQAKRWSVRRRYDLGRCSYLSKITTRRTGTEEKTILFRVYHEENEITLGTSFETQTSSMNFEARSAFGEC